MIGALLGLLGGALVAVGSRAFGERARRLLGGALAGALAATLLAGRWTGSGIGLASLNGPVVWSENLLVIAALPVGVAAVVGAFIAYHLPRVGQRP